MNHLIVFFDYECAYSYTVARWLRQVESLEGTGTARWHPFVLKEVNRSSEEKVPFWEQPSAPQTPTGVALIAGQAAARQGPDAYERFRFLLQAAIHDQQLDIRKSPVLAGVAVKAELDVGRFEHDRRQPGLLEEAGRSHRDAVRRYGVFGTPTLVFPNGQGVYLKLAKAPSSDGGPWLFELLRELAERQPDVEEFKLTRRGKTFRN